jgi:hypothetical protein
VGTKAERRAASEHSARLAELIEYITAAVDRYRTREIDAYAVDEAIHHYHRATGELWKFCWSGGGGTHIEITADLLDRMATDGEAINWSEWVPPTDGLALVLYANSVRYDSGPQRRPLVQRLISDRTPPAGYATDDCPGVLYRGTEFVQALRERGGAAGGGTGTGAAAGNGGGYSQVEWV